MGSFKDGAKPFMVAAGACMIVFIIFYAAVVGGVCYKGDTLQMIIVALMLTGVGGTLLNVVQGVTAGAYSAKGAMGAVGAGIAATAIVGKVGYEILKSPTVVRYAMIAGMQLSSNCSPPLAEQPPQL